MVNGKRYFLNQKINVNKYHFMICCIIAGIGAITCQMVQHYVNDQISSPAPEGVTIPSEVYECLQSGDLILESGYSMLSHAIIRLLDEPRPFSHMGMLLQDQSEWKVLHMLSSEISEVDGLRTEPLVDFLEEAHPDHLLIVRPRGLKANDLVQSAEYYLQQQVPFDRFFDLTDTSAFYCSEFIYHAMMRAGLPEITPDTLRNGRVYLGFRHFYDESLVEIIYDK